MDRQHTIEGILEDFHEIGHVVAAAFRPFNAENNISYSQMIMLRVVKAKPGLGIKELSNLIGITSSAATQQVDGLVRNGYLIRTSNTDDRRSLSLYISPDLGRRTEELKTAFLEKVIEYFKVLSDEELAEYARINKKIAGSVAGKQSTD